MSTKPPKILSIVLGLILGGLALFLAVRYLVPWLAPFILAFAVAMLIEPLISFLGKRAHIPRSLAALLCVIAVFGAFIALCCALIGRVASEIQTLLVHLPQTIDSITVTLHSLRDWFYELVDRVPDGLGDYLHITIESITKQLAELPTILTGKLLPLATSLAAATPDILFFTVTAVIGAYFTCASYADIRHFVLLQIPKSFQTRARRLFSDLKSTLGHFLKAQAILTLITFGELVVAFSLLRVKYALSLAIFTAIVDLLPVLGTGTVLLPWAAYCLLTGDIPLGVGLVITYGAITVLRNMIQAKLLGDELGLHPLVTLVSIYVGFRACGVIGMMIFPILAITLKQLNDSELLHLWKKEKLTE